MNRPKFSYNLLFHMQQKVVLPGSGPWCAILESWKLLTSRLASHPKR